MPAAPRRRAPRSAGCAARAAARAAPSARSTSTVRTNSAETTPDERAEHEIEQELARVLQLVGRDDVRRVIFEQRARDERGGDGGEDDRAVELERQTAEEDLEAEERAADRRVVGGGDAGRGAAGDQQLELIGVDVGAAAEPAGGGGAEVDERAFAADAGAHGDGDEREKAARERRRAAARGPSAPRSTPGSPTSRGPSAACPRPQRHQHDDDAGERSGRAGGASQGAACVTSSSEPGRATPAPAPAA